ncbi:MotE family protein [Ancylobacter sp. FA202]|uniref:MotE family protein n=1 Tax=Ancylobacter sp. FA202 TaxID=1111106 RepID=UPI000375F4FC|nr:MotE family protein [Ancylobacter sp. FA202]
MSMILVFSHLAALTVGCLLGLLSAALCFAARDSEPTGDEGDEEPARLPPPVRHTPAPHRDWSERAVKASVIVALTLGTTFLGVLSLRAETAPAADPAATPPIATRPAPAAPKGDNADQYCQAMVDAVRDARFARQQAALAALEKEIEERIAKLEAKRAEYEQWLTRREDFLNKADGAVIAVISQMRPDAAAAQLTIMGDDPAAAILAKLNARVASAILNEMEPARAARLTGVMVGIAKRTAPGGKSS